MIAEGKELITERDVQEFRSTCINGHKDKSFVEGISNHHNGSGILYMKCEKCGKGHNVRWEESKK